MKKVLRRYLVRYREEPLILGLCILCLISLGLCGVDAISIGRFMLQSSYLFFFALGTVVILSIGEIDISIYGIACLSSIVSIWLGYNLFGSGLLAAITVMSFTMIISVALSLINGCFIVKGSRPSLLVTISTFTLFYGIALVLFLSTHRHQDGRNIYGIPELIQLMPRTRLLNVRTDLIIIVLTLFVLWMLFDKTKLGLEMKAIGLNSFSAMFSGVSRNKTMWKAFAIAGILYGLGSILSYARFASTRPSELVKDPVVPIMVAVLSGGDIRGGRLPLLFVLFGFAIFVSLKRVIDAQDLLPAEAYYALHGAVLLLLVAIRYKHQKGV